jgi:hypothetical protein
VFRSRGFRGETADGVFANDTWCLAVITRYLMPASFAIRARFRAKDLSGAETQRRRSKVLSFMCCDNRREFGSGF